MRGAAMLRADCGKIVIAVSDDIDPTNTDAIFWSLAYRANLGEDLQVAPYRSGGHGPKSGGGRKGDSTPMIDATAKGPMPPPALPAREYMEGGGPHLGRARPAAPRPAPALARLLARRLGCAAWDVFAQRAVDGTHLGAERPRHLRAAAAGSLPRRRRASGEEVTSM